MATLALQPSLLDELRETPARVERASEPRAVPQHAPAERDAAPVAEPHEPAPASGGRTFEDVIAGAWAGLASAHAASCLLCGGSVRPGYGAGPKPVAGTCRDCGTEIT